MSVYVRTRGQQLCLCLLTGLENKVLYFSTSSLGMLLGKRYAELPDLFLGSQSGTPPSQKLSSISEACLVLTFSLKVCGLERHAF